MLNMRFLALVCVAVVAASAAPAPEEDKYTDKYDNINLDEILDNKRLLSAYVDCIMERGKCTPEGKELKEHLQEALESGCEKCTEKQKEGTKKTINHLIKHEIEAWKEVSVKYDPTGKWRKKYEDVAKEHGIEIPA